MRGIDNEIVWEAPGEISVQELIDQLNENIKRLMQEQQL